MEWEKPESRAEIGVENSYKQVITVIKDNQSFLIASHAHPDGDGIGSTLAIGLALKALGKDVVMYNQDGVPWSLEFLSGSDQLVTELAGDSGYGATIMIDCAQPERAGRHFPAKDRRGTLVCIDHHIARCEVADVVCQDNEASSTGEVVYNILKRLGAEITPEIATQILTTIIVDTGFFRYSNTSSHALEMAAELVGRGASTWLICKNMEERNPREQLRLLSGTLETIEYHLNGQLAIMTLTRQMLKHAAASVEVAEEFINFPRSIDGVEVAVLVREKARNEFKISFRSKDIIDVALLAGKFDGGGHEHAAGCTVKGCLGEVKQTIIRAVSDALSKGIRP